ncbi:LysR family substrate-binding domain-containing protein, partial [Aeromonas caviae]
DVLAGHAGTLRIGFGSPPSCWCPPPSPFSGQPPRVAIELNDLSTHHQLLALAEGRLDLGFCRLPAPKGWPVLPVVRAHFVAVLPAGYQGVAGLADLQEKPLAILRRDKAPSFYDQFIHYLAQSGLRFQDIQYVNDFAAGIATAAAGIAWTLVPSSTTIEHPDVLTLPLGEADASWIIGLIRPPGNDNPLVAPFWQTVAELADPALTGLMTTGDGAPTRDTP